ncbi:MAG: arsenate reductase (glutaredoxin) [Eudoraea sp.]|nr:arsenate reductase (glutaredoxin) [Eudoraea sp.]
MLKIYHNPRCRKSREGLAILENSGKEFEQVLYLKNIPTREELLDLLNKLGYAPIDLVRTNEAIWKENFKGKSLTDAMIIDAMLQHPKLIERPIVVSEGKAVVGRPPEKIKDIL